LPRESFPGLLFNRFHGFGSRDNRLNTAAQTRSNFALGSAKNSAREGHTVQLITAWRVSQPLARIIHAEKLTFIFGKVNFPTFRPCSFSRACSFAFPLAKKPQTVGRVNFLWSFFSRLSKKVNFSVCIIFVVCLLSGCEAYY
jgi:hypothetical protein